VGERQRSRTCVAANLWGDEIRVLEIESEGQEFAMEVEAKDQGGDGEDCEDSVIEGEDAQDPACVELAKVGRVGERIVEDSSDEEAGKDEEQIDTIGTEGVGAMQGGLEGGVWTEGEKLGADNPDNPDNCEATDTIQSRYVPRVGACFRCRGTGNAGRHLC